MTPLLKPPRLAPGGTIGVVALSGPPGEEKLERGCSALRAMGFGVKVARNALSRSEPLGLAGTDGEKLEAWRELREDPEVGAILLARGGYGITRLLPRLDPEEFRRRPLLHAGFSDGTALSAFLLRRCGIPSLHSPMAAAEVAAGLDPLTARFFPSALLGTAPGELEAPGADVIVPGRAEGPLVGGCLSLLAALVGNPDEFDYDGALLFLEETGEAAYRVDRMLGTLESAGRFDKLAGVLVGSMTRVTFGDREEPGRLRALLAERLGRLGVPVAAGLPFGHHLPNVPLPVGARASWDGESRVLTFVEGIVR